MTEPTKPQLARAVGFALQRIVRLVLASLLVLIGWIGTVLLGLALLASILIYPFVISIAHWEVWEWWGHALLWFAFAGFFVFCHVQGRQDTVDLF